MVDKYERRKLGAFAEMKQRIQDESQQIVQVELPDVNFAQLNKEIAGNIGRALGLTSQTVAVQASREAGSGKANLALIKSLKVVTDAFVQLRNEQRATLESMSDEELNQAIYAIKFNSEGEDDCLTPPTPRTSAQIPQPAVPINFLPKPQNQVEPDSTEEESEMPKSMKAKKSKAPPENKAPPKKGLGPARKVSVDFNKLEQDKKAPKGGADK